MRYHIKSLRIRRCGAEAAGALVCVEHRAPVVAAPWEEAPPRGATARTLPDGDDYHLRLGQLQVRAGPS